MIGHGSSRYQRSLIGWGTSLQSSERASAATGDGKLEPNLGDSRSWLGEFRVGEDCNGMLGPWRFSILGSILDHAGQFCVKRRDGACEVEGPNESVVVS